MAESDNMQSNNLSIKVSALYGSVGLKSRKVSTQVNANIKACDLPHDNGSYRAPVDLVVALDVSGSMHGEKLSLCKKTIGLLLQELRPEDRFGLITFSDDAVIDVPTRKLKSGGGKEAVLAIVNGLDTRNTTNLSGGILISMNDLQNVEDPNAVRSVFLLTDGLANKGITDNAGIVDLVKGYVDGDSGAYPITIHTFGYGKDHDQSLLRNISTATVGGTYYFVDNDANVSSAFGDALGGVLSVVAQQVDLKIHVPSEASNHGVKILNVHHKRKVKLDDGTWKVSLGDFYAEESRDVVFEVTLASRSTKAPGNFCGQRIPHVQVSMSFMDTITKQSRSTDLPLPVYILRPEGTRTSSPHIDVAVQWMRVCATEAMEKAEKIACEGKLDTAQEVIRKQLKELDRQASEGCAQSHSLVYQLKVDLKRILDGFVDWNRYDLYGRHRAAQMSQTYYMQRCNEADETVSNIYRTGQKMGRATGFKRARIGF